ncbi:hypothetical protein CBB_A0175 [Clostridium botulinum Bf]|nr:hypothetical protein CBB_A0175 [Clostridium botulinum Bf]
MNTYLSILIIYLDLLKKFYFIIKYYHKMNQFSIKSINLSRLIFFILYFKFISFSFYVQYISYIINLNTY